MVNVTIHDLNATDIDIDLEEHEDDMSHSRAELVRDNVLEEHEGMRLTHGPMSPQIARDDDLMLVGEFESVIEARIAKDARGPGRGDSHHLTINDRQDQHL